MLNNKKVLLFTVIIALAVLYFLFFNQAQDQNNIKLISAPADRGDIVSIVTANGSLQPNLEIRIHPEINGVIEEINVDTNDKVNKGQILAKIGSNSYSIKLNEAKAKYNKAAANLKLDKDTFNANKTLHSKDLISSQEFETSRAKYKNALASFEEAKTSLNIAESNLEKTNIKSTIDGIVLSKNITNGQIVSDTNNTQPLFTIADGLENLNLIINVSEADIGKIKNGQKVSFKVSSFPDKSFAGNIIKISNSPNTSKNIVTYDITASIDNSALLLKPGMTAEVNIIIANKKNVLRVPTSALRFVPVNAEYNSSANSDQLSVWVINPGNKLTEIPVTTGVSNNEYTEIKDDGTLKEGQEIIIESFVNSNSSKSLITLPQPKRF
jgi:HlyD family secretion protein